jgi:NHLM bacteriocin system ABC transporter peptidase/ATP-binding protein
VAELDWREPGLDEKRPPRRRRTRTPTVLQMEAVECGAASLAIVLAHFGRRVPLEELRVACGVSRDGAKASNVLRAARAYGLESQGYRLELPAVRAARFPLIVYWDFNHFLVVEGYADGKYFLNDPAEGPRTITEQEFDEGFTGIALVLRPGPSFQPGGSTPGLTATLREHARGVETALLYVLLAGVLLVVPGIVVPTFSQIFVDQVLVGRLHGWLRPLIIALAAVVLLRIGLSWLQQRYLLRLETRLATTGTSRFLWHLLHLPVEFYAHRYSGEISSRVQIYDRIARFLGGRLTGSLVDAVLVAAFGALMLAYDWRLALVAIGSVALTVAAAAAVNRARVDGNRRVLQEQGKALGALMGGLANIETLKASGLESDLFARWAGYHAKYLNARQRFAATTQFFLVVPTFLTALTGVVVLGVGAHLVVRGDLTLGMLVAFQALTVAFLSPVNNLVGLASNVQEMHGNLNRIDDVLRYRTDPALREEADGEAPASKLDGRVDLRALTFGYSRLSDPVLREFSFSLTPGSRVAVVGASGCGKSTLARLITGLYAPWEGEVLLDGTRREELPRRRLTSSVAVVDQDIALYEGTVRDNLTLWDPTVPDSVVVQAARDACIHEEIVARRGGYDSLVAEGGSNFSGGQRQRLEIARALVGDPRVLVLDEATSALDAITEQEIDRNLRRRGCTTVVIAHRLSTIRDADEILVMERGRLVQRGTHEQLIRQEEGSYARLLQEI